MKISTKSGDKGESGLFDGRRLKKSDVVFDLLGDLDELNSFLGWSRQGGNELLERIQGDIYRIMSIVGFEMRLPNNIEAIDESDVGFLETEIERLEESLEEKFGGMREFVTPGGSEKSSRLDIARTVCRRAERSFVRAGFDGELAGLCLRYLNRLSDLLFLLARNA